MPVTFIPAENRYEADSIDEVIEVAAALKGAKPISIVQVQPRSVDVPSACAGDTPKPRSATKKRRRYTAIKKYNTAEMMLGSQVYTYVTNGSRRLPADETVMMQVYNVVRGSATPLTARQVSSKAGVLYQSCGGLLIDLYRRGLLARRKHRDGVQFEYVQSQVF